MKVSIIIPVYNSAEYVGKCLTSVINQTYTDIEVIIIDDCSTDSSIEVVNRLIQDIQFPVSICKNDYNCGVSFGRNRGIQKATGEYLFFIDSDDSITPDCLEKLVAQTESLHPDMVVADYELTSKIPSAKIKRNGIVEGNMAIQQSYFNREWNEMVWNKLIRRDFLLEHELFFDEKLRWHQDTLWSFMVIFYLKTIVFLRDVTYYYHIHDNSIVTGTCPMIGTEENIDVCEKMYQHALEMNCYTKELNDYMIDFFSNIILDSILKKEYSIPYRYEGYCKMYSLLNHLSLYSYIQSGYSRGMKLFSLHQILPKWMGFLYALGFCRASAK